MAHRSPAKLITGYLLLFASLALLPFTLSGLKQTVRTLTRAKNKPAQITVNPQVIQQPLDPFWRGISQGAENPGRPFANVETQLTQLRPRWVRIDHVFDHYQLVHRNAQGQLVLDFSQLDQTVNTITQSGATPFFSLSYTPLALAPHGNPVEKPSNWPEWQTLVANFILHYSRDQNLSRVYYEVWNEPDLFGYWKTRGAKNYLDLYYYTARAAQQVANRTRPFYLGGPATTGLYPNWITKLAKFAEQNRLPLDFISWHRYHSDPQQFVKDLEWVNKWKQKTHRQQLQTFITEWGLSSENHPGNDTSLAAAHAVATIRAISGKIDGSLTFELVDSLSPQKKPFWGRWGMVTHPGTGGLKKPKFRAFTLLNRLGPQKILVLGEGTWVKAIASLSSPTSPPQTKLLLVNYDPNQARMEQVPVSFVNLNPGRYTWHQEHLGGEVFNFSELTQDGTLSRKVTLPPNEVVLITLTPQTSKPQQVAGISNQGYNLSFPSGIPLQISLPQGMSSATIEFWFQLQQVPSSIDQLLFTLPVGGGRQLQTILNQNQLAWGIFLFNQPQAVATTKLSSSTIRSWHHLAVDWDQGKSLNIWLDGRLVGRYQGHFTSGLASPLTFPVSSLTIDELRVSRGLRYASPFTPPKSALPDPQTIVFKNF